MKKNILLLALVLILCHSLSAQKAPYKVVFDVTSSDTVLHKMVLRWVGEVLTADPNAEVEVVFYAKSLDMITKDKSTVADNVMKFAAKKNVAFRVCSVAMKNNNVEKSQLLEGVGTVPDGIYEIISKQHEGWGYIKAAR
ncbi:MAG: DsrE family protein [Bacteroidia bacterium]|nr:DsrE family protein [Bacteroidia bacterium]